MTTVFSQIIEGKLPSEKLYEDDLLIVIKDLYPVAPVHLLIIPKKAYKDIQSVPEEDLSVMSHVVKVAQMMAKQSGIEDGYRLITNNGKAAGQVIFHLHFHLIGGRQLGVLG